MALAASVKLDVGCVSLPPCPLCVRSCHYLFIYRPVVLHFGCMISQCMLFPALVFPVQANFKIGADIVGTFEKINQSQKTAGADKKQFMVLVLDGEKVALKKDASLDEFKGDYEAAFEDFRKVMIDEAPTVGFFDFYAKKSDGAVTMERSGVGRIKFCPDNLPIKKKFMVGQLYNQLENHSKMSPKFGVQLSDEKELTWTEMVEELLKSYSG